MALDLLRQMYQAKNAASIGTSWSLNSEGAFINISGVVGKYVNGYLESSGLPDEQKAILIDYDKFFKNALAGNDAAAESISSRYENIHTAALHALARASDKTTNPYALMIADIYGQ
jgi:hypothetical protein